VYHWATTFITLLVAAAATLSLTPQVALAFPTPEQRAVSAFRSVGSGSNDFFANLDFLLALRRTGQTTQLEMYYRARFRLDRSNPLNVLFYALATQEPRWKRTLLDKLTREKVSSPYGPLGRALDEYPPLLEYWYDGDTSYEQTKGAQQRAKRWLDRGFKRAPNSAPMLYFLGVFHLLTRQQRQAISFLERAARFEPNCSALQKDYGEALLVHLDITGGSRSARRTLAVQALSRALAVDRFWLFDRTRQDCHHARARALVIGNDGHWFGPQSDVDAAEECLRNCLDQGFDFQCLELLCTLLCRTGRIDTALRLISEGDTSGRCKETMDRLYCRISRLRSVTEGQTSIHSKRGKTVIVVNPPPWRTRHVWLVGDFCQWQRGIHALEIGTDGALRTELSLAPGRYRYGFWPENEDYYSYDESAPDFKDGASAFTVLDDGTISSSPTSLYEFHMARAKLVPLALDPRPATKEALEALKIEPTNATPLVTINRVRWLYSDFADPWKMRRPSWATTSHDVALAALDMDDFLEASPSDPNDERSAQLRALIRSARAAGIRGSALVERSMALEPDEENKFKLFVEGLEQKHDLTALAEAYTSHCTGTQFLESFGALARKSGEVGALVMYGNWLNRDEQDAKAVEVFENLLPLRRKVGFAAWQALLDLLRVAATTPETQQTYLRTLERAIAELPHCRQLALEYLDAASKPDDDPITFLEPLLERHPSSAALAGIVGNLCRKKGKNSRARKLLERAVAIAPGWSWALVQLSEILRDEGLFGKALTYSRRCFRSNRSNAYPASLMAEAHGHHRRFERRALVLEEALEHVGDPAQREWLQEQLLAHYTNIRPNKQRAYELVRTLFTEGRENKAPDLQQRAMSYFWLALDAKRTRDLYDVLGYLDGGVRAFGIVCGGLIVLFGGTGFILLLFWLITKRWALLSFTASVLLVVWINRLAAALGLFSVSYAVFGRFFAFLCCQGSSEAYLSVYASTLTGAIGTALILPIIVGAHRQGLASIGIKRGPRREEFILGLGAGVGLVALQMSLSRLIVLLLGKMPEGIFGLQEHPETARLMHLYPVGSLAVLAVVVFLAPPVEEMFFRGFLMGRLSKHFNPRWALVGSALLFAIMHASALVHLFLVALLLGYLYQRCETLWPAVFAHMTMNGVVILIAYIRVY